MLMIEESEIIMGHMGRAGLTLSWVRLNLRKRMMMMGNSETMVKEHGRNRGLSGRLSVSLEREFGGLLVFGVEIDNKTRWKGKRWV